MNEKWLLYALTIFLYDNSDLIIKDKHYELKKEFVFRKRVLFISFYIILLFVNFFLITQFSTTFILKVIYFFLFNIFYIIIYPIFATFFFPKALEDTFDFESNF